jgi:hypothetical protein
MRSSTDREHGDPYRSTIPTAVLSWSSPRKPPWPTMIGLCHWVASQDQWNSWAWLPMGMVGSEWDGVWVSVAYELGARGGSGQRPVAHGTSGQQGR